MEVALSIPIYNMRILINLDGWLFVGLYVWYSGVCWGLRVLGYKKVRKKGLEIFGKE